MAYGEQSTNMNNSKQPKVTRGSRLTRRLSSSPASLNSTTTTTNASSSSSIAAAARTFCCTEDCDSSFTMRIKCRRGQLIFAFPFLAIIFVVINGWLFVAHSRYITTNNKPLIATTIGGGVHSPETTLALLKQHQQQHPPEDGKQPTATAIRQTIKVDPQKAQRQQGVGRSSIENFFHKRIGGPINNNNNSMTASSNRSANTTSNIKPRRKGRRKRKQEETEVVELPPPRPESLHENATFSACLLIRDDNDILPEWLAYHYHVLGLRHLIVAIDPLSSESPSSILQQWRNRTELEVLEWTDAHFMPASFLKLHHPPIKYMQEKDDFDFNISQEALLEISNHRYRQRVFLAKCMLAHRQKGNSWVMHIDTDEYVVASKLLRQMNPDYLDIPNMTQPNSVLRLLQQAVRKTAQAVSYPCISMLRVLFGSVESRQEDVNYNVPTGFNASSFETLRWRYHALPHNMSIHGNPKVILDVAAIPEQYFPNEVVYSIHRPVEDFCHKNKDLTFTSFRKQPIAVNHYLGSWERYAGRNDKRRSREVYNMKANVKRGKDDGIREWLMGFCNLVGHDVAAELLGPSYLTTLSNTSSSSSSSIIPSLPSLNGTAGAAHDMQHLVLPDGSVSSQPVVVVANDLLSSTTADASESNMIMVTDDDGDDDTIAVDA